MSGPLDSESHGDVASANAGRTIRGLGLIGWAVLFVAYTLMFRGFGQSDLAAAAQRALINTLPAALLAWPVVRLVERTLVDASWVKQILGHLALALGYGFAWYVGVQVGYGLREGLPAGGIVGRPLSGVALTWQLYQGVTLYAVVALYAYVVTYRTRLFAAERALDRQSAAQSIAAALAHQTPEAPVRQILLKDGRAIRPTRLDEIRLISGAGDYVRVVTRDACFLSSTPLASFERDLPRADFLRVHRSHLVRLDAVLSVESGGNGRLVLHLPDGLSITTSRAGAKAFRNRAL